MSLATETALHGEDTSREHGNSPLCGIKLPGNTPLSYGVRMNFALLGRYHRLLEDVRERTLVFDLPGAYVARFVHRTFVMRVHTCRHCGEVFPFYPDLRQHLDSHLQPPVGHICMTCNKSFTRREHLLKHSARCTPKAYVLQCMS